MVNVLDNNHKISYKAVGLREELAFAPVVLL